jgi:hypothetical protein
MSTYSGAPDECSIHWPRKLPCAECTAIVFTNAPSAYDYSYVVELERDLTYVQYEGQKSPPTTVRKLAIPRSHVQYQTDRYRSGCYLVEVQV